MESNADKQLREKLNGVDYPFDPQAWEKMEAMLDEKKKRRGFFWWWFGGIAAALLITAGTIGYGLWLMGEEDRFVSAEYAQKQVENRKQAVGSKQLAVAESQETRNENQEQTAKGEEQVANDNEGETVNGKVQKAKGKANSVLSKAHFTNREQQTTNNKPQTKLTRHSSPAAKHTRKDAQAQRSKKGFEQMANNEAGYNNNSIQNQATTTAVSATTTQKEEALSLNTMYALLQATEAAFDATKDEDNTLPRKKKPVFRYSLGIAGTLTAATPGWKHYNHQYEAYQAGKPAFYATPSYMVGLTNDFLFANRFAFSVGLMYAQTSFKVYGPYAGPYSQVPVGYTSHIKGLATPMGIKVYPVVTNNFKLYVSAGFIHHIKLQETFSYTMPDTVSNAIVNIPPSSKDAFFPTQTSFGSDGYEAIQADQMGNLSTVMVNTKPFSINEAKRYYTSFYAGLGVEGIIRNHWILFAEPTYYMTLQRIGYQERRKFDFGGSAGFRYQF